MNIKFLKEREFGHLARATAAIRVNSYCCSSAATKKITLGLRPMVI